MENEIHHIQRMLYKIKNYKDYLVSIQKKHNDVGVQNHIEKQISTLSKAQKFYENYKTETNNSESRKKSVKEQEKRLHNINYLSKNREWSLTTLNGKTNIELNFLRRIEKIFEKNELRTELKEIGVRIDYSESTAKLKKLKIQAENKKIPKDRKKKVPAQPVKGNVRWLNRKLEYKYYDVIRKYIDDCINNNADSEFRLTFESDLLLKLIDQIKETIPKIKANNLTEIDDEYKAMYADFFEINKDLNDAIRASTIQRRILENRGDEIKKKTINGILLRVKKINWEILPKGCDFRKIVTAHYVRLQEANPKVVYELWRIDAILKLSPDEVYQGKNEFNGYVAFEFWNKGLTLLECPIKGNAIYLIKSPDWLYLTTLSKNNLLTFHSKSVSRIIHNGDWLSRLKDYMARL
jgi:hypothetical protein